MNDHKRKDSRAHIQLEDLIKNQKKLE